MLRQQVSNAENFIRSLFGDAYLDSQLFVEDVLVRAKETNSIEPLSALRSALQVKTRELEEKIDTYPIDPEGSWLSLDEIRKSGIGKSPADIEKNIAANPDAFVKQGDGKYYISSANISNIATTKEGIEMAENLLTYQVIKARTLRVNLELSGLESMVDRSVEKTVNAASVEREVELPVALKIEGGGVWMSYKQIAVTSRYTTKNSLKQVINTTHAGKFEKRGNRRNRELFVTPNNYMFAGMKEFPGNGIKDIQSTGSSPQIQSSGSEVDSINRTDKKVAPPRVDNYEGKLGVWVNSRHLAEIFHVQQSKIVLSKRIKTLKDVRETKIIGAAFEGFVTPENFSKVGLASFPLPYVYGENEEQILPERIGPISQQPLSKVDEAGNIWMSYGEITDKTSLTKGYTGMIIRGNTEKFKTRGNRRSLEVLITPENFELVHLTNFPGDPALVTKKDLSNHKAPDVQKQASSAPQMTNASNFRIGIKETHIEHDRQYSSQEVASIFTTIHSGYFLSSFAQEKVLKHLKVVDGNVKGKNLADLVERTNGMMLLTTTSTKKELETHVGLPYENLEPSLIGDPDLKKFVHEIPGVVDTRFILRREMHEFIDAMKDKGLTGKTVRSSTPSLGSKPLDKRKEEQISDQDRIRAQELKSQYDVRLTTEHIMPTSGQYENLLQKGVFDVRTSDSIRRSYERFIGAMKGYRLFDTRPFQQKSTLSSVEFSRGYIAPLLNDSSIVNIAPRLGMDTGSTLFAVKAEEYDEVVKRLDRELAS